MSSLVNLLSEQMRFASMHIELQNNYFSINCLQLEVYGCRQNDSSNSIWDELLIDQNATIFFPFSLFVIVSETKVLSFHNPLMTFLPSEKKTKQNETK